MAEDFSLSLSTFIHPEKQLKEKQILSHPGVTAASEMKMNGLQLDCCSGKQMNKTWLDTLWRLEHSFIYP